MAGSKTKHSYDPSDLTVKEVKELQRVTEKKFGHIIREFRTDDFDVDTMQAIIWLFHRRDDSSLTFDQVEDMKIKVLFTQNGDSPNP